MFLGRPFVRDSQILPTSRSWSQTCLLYTYCHFTGCPSLAAPRILDFGPTVSWHSAPKSWTFSFGWHFHPSNLNPHTFLVTLKRSLCDPELAHYILNMWITSIIKECKHFLFTTTDGELTTCQGCHFWIVETEIIYIELKPVFLRFSILPLGPRGVGKSNSPDMVNITGIRPRFRS